MGIFLKKKPTPVVVAEPEATPLPMLVQVSLAIPGTENTDHPYIECTRVLSVYDCHLVNLVATTNGDPDGCYSLSTFFTDNTEINDILVSLEVKICRNGDHLYVSTNRSMFRQVDFSEKLFRNFYGQNICIGTIVKMNLGMNKN